MWERCVAVMRVAALLFRTFWSRANLIRTAEEHSSATAEQVMQQSGAGNWQHSECCQCTDCVCVFSGCNICNPKVQSLALRKVNIVQLNAHLQTVCWPGTASSCIDSTARSPFFADCPRHADVITTTRPSVLKKVCLSVPADGLHSMLKNVSCEAIILEMFEVGTIKSDGSQESRP